MYLCDTLPGSLKTHFQAASGFGNYEFVTEFPAIKRKIPLTKIIVSFGIDNAKITQPTDEDGASVYDSYHDLETVVKFTIHGARDSGGESLYLAFSKIAGEVLENMSLEVDEISCSEVKYDRNTDSVRLVGKMTVVSTIA